MEEACCVRHAACCMQLTAKCMPTRHLLSDKPFKLVCFVIIFQTKLEAVAC